MFLIWFFFYKTTLRRWCHWDEGNYNLKWQIAALKCDDILFILNPHKALRLDETLPSCQSRCHRKLGSLTTPDGGGNQQRRTLHLPGRSVSSQITFFPSAPHAGEFTCVGGAALSCHFLPAHLIKYCFITSGENVTDFARFFFLKKVAKNVSWHVLKSATGEIKIDAPACLLEEKYN